VAEDFQRCGIALQDGIGVAYQVLLCSGSGLDFAANAYLLQLQQSRDNQ